MIIIWEKIANCYDKVLALYIKEKRKVISFTVTCVAETHAELIVELVHLINNNTVILQYISYLCILGLIC